MESHEHEEEPSGYLEEFAEQEQQRSRRRRSPNRTLEEREADLVAQLEAVRAKMAGDLVDETQEIISAIIALKDRAIRAKLGDLAAACSVANTALTDAAPNQRK